jgi:hypothetical protein
MSLHSPTFTSNIFKNCFTLLGHAALLFYHPMDADIRNNLKQAVCRISWAHSFFAAFVLNLIRMIPDKL